MELKDVQQAVADEVKPLTDKVEAVKNSADAEIKKLGDNIKVIEEKVNKLPKDETFTKSVDEVKVSLKAIEDWKVTKDEADKANQKWIDEQVANNKAVKVNDGQTKTFKDAFVDAMNEGENYKNLEMLATSHKERKKRFVIEIKAAADMSTTNVTGTRYGSIYDPNIITIPSRKVHVRQLVPVSPLGPGNTYTFLREASTGEGDPAPVAEGSSKPQFDFDFTEPSVNVETIAGFVRFTKKVMNNLPGFAGFLSNRLPEKLLRVEDAQLLTGDGNTPNISGIMDSGNYTAATSSATVFAEQLIDGLAQLEDDEERNATGILVRPVNYYSFFKNTASGSGEYDLPQNFVFANGVLYVSGVPVFASTALTNGKYIIGDWNQGAQLFIQNAMRIEFFEQDADNVTKNKITARIEEDIAFPVYADNYFLVGDVASSS